MDVDGIVRVYELPLGRPWRRIVGWSFAVALIPWPVASLVRFWKRHRSNRAS
jgi:hypothetical protein